MEVYCSKHIFEASVSYKTYRVVYSLHQFLPFFFNLRWIFCFYPMHIQFFAFLTIFT
jgi:hypothetical protein